MAKLALRAGSNYTERGYPLSHKTHRRTRLARFLVIEDEPVLARNICESLERAGHATEIRTTAEEGIQAARSGAPDLILLDYRLPGRDGLHVLRSLENGGSAPPAIMITAHGDVSTAVEAMKAGARDFLTKPVDLETLHLVINRTLQQRKIADELTYFKERDRAALERAAIIGDSPAMQKVKDLIDRITATPALRAENPPSVLITGETGTGKGLIARALHYAGPRADASFVHVNCTAIPEHLAESELFGHVKGAFTDAKTDRRGLFEVADNGTLFLDEIGHMSLKLQAKLLSVLEQRVVRRVGASQDCAVDIHVIAATNRNLDQAVDCQEFREDLLHRLRVLRIEMPPLHKRGGDVEQLARHCLAATSARYHLDVRGFDSSALDAIHSYVWPGNVRELQHTIESAALIANAEVLTAEHLGINVTPRTRSLDIRLEPESQVIKIDFDNTAPTLDEIENRILRAAMDHFDQNLSRAARVLGLSRDAIRYRLQKFEKTSGPPSPCASPSIQGHESV